MENKLILSLYDKKLDGLDFNIIFDIINLYGNGLVKGIELNGDDLDGMKKCANLCKKNNIRFMCHIPVKNMRESDIIKYLNCVNDISKKLRYTINVAVHSLNNNKSLRKNIDETYVYLKNILSYIKKYNLNITISLENLNKKDGERRINISSIDNVLNKFEELKFTYDIGHDIYDNRKPSDLSALQKIKINNVHVHSIVESIDHNIIQNKSKDIEEIKKAILNLKNINYKGTIVLEYAMKNIPGSTVEEKIINFVKAFKIFKNDVMNKI